MKKVVIIMVIGVLLPLGLSSGALGARVYVGGYFGFPYYAYPYAYYPYAYPYYYPYAYPYPYYPDAYAQPQVYIEQEQPSDWYYCQNPQGYYPYVTSCPGGWTRVVPTPPPPGREGVER